MKNCGDLGGCYPPRPTATTDNTLFDLHNSSQATQPHSSIVLIIYSSKGDDNSKLCRMLVHLIQVRPIRDTTQLVTWSLAVMPGT